MAEEGHIQITEFNKEIIPKINWMMEDLFCQYGVSIPYFLLDFSFPDYSQRPEWVTGYRPEWYMPEWYQAEWKNFWPTWFYQGLPDQYSGYNWNLDWGEWGYYLPWLNELSGLLFDEANLPRETLPDLSPASISLLNDYVNMLYGSVTAEYSPESGGGLLYTKRRGGFLCFG